MNTTAAGFAVIDKPAGMTSHDVVAAMRRLAATRKVGHGGTLDPMATGVLIVAVGRVTRLLTYITGCDKSYDATIRLGASTVTDDAEGETVSTADTATVTDESIRHRLAAMVGDIEQVPSAVSAVKVAGKRAYARVREGERVRLEARPVTISRLDVRQIRRGDHLDVDISLDCSAGTYVRAVARDLGEDLEVGGHLTTLRRTRVGGFSLSEARTLTQLESAPVTHSVAEAVTRIMPGREVDAADAVKLSHGGKLSPIGWSGPYAVLGPDGSVLGVVAESEGAARPQVVLHAA